MFRNSLMKTFKTSKACMMRSSTSTRAFTQATLPDLPYGYGELEDAISGQMQVVALRYQHTGHIRRSIRMPLG